jgi:hypothetical protein
MATDASHSSRPRYLGPSLIVSTTLKELQPAPDQWVQPIGWTDQGWEPRITYRGIPDDVKETLIDGFSLFEEEADEPAEKGFILMSSLRLLFRTLGRSDSKQNAAIEKRFLSKAVARATDGALVLHISKFLEAMDDELRVEAVSKAQRDADR